MRSEVAKRLLKKIPKELHDKVQAYADEIAMWAMHDKRIEQWEIEYRNCEPKDKDSDKWFQWQMNKAMMKPNEPHYTTANND